MKAEKIDKILLELYTEMYAKSTPSADFNKLMVESDKNERGEIDIPFNDYEIDWETYDDIFKSTMKKYRVPKYMVQKFSTSVALGCSPKIKRV